MAATYNNTRDFVVAFQDAIELLGYTLSDDMFDFDAVPASKIDKAYRIEVETDGMSELTGLRIEKTKRMTVWVAYKVTAKGDREEAFLDILDLIEGIEDEFLSTVAGINYPSTIEQSTMSKYVNNYIMLRFVGVFTYWRTIT